MSNKNNGFWLPYSVLAGLVVIRLVPLMAGTKYLWGVGHLTLLASGYAIGYAVLGAVALIIPWLPQAEKWGEKISQWFAQTFFEAKSKYVARGVLIAVAEVLFVLFAMPTHFLGDGMTSLANLASNEGHWIKWSEAGAVVAVMKVQAVLGSKTEQTALRAFQLVSIPSGAIAAWFYFLIAKTLSREPTKRLLTFVILFFSSTLLLYFGYVESYPIMWGPLAGFLYFSLKYSMEGRGVGPALACLLLTLFLHLQAGMFVPAFAFLLLSRGAGLRLYRKAQPFIWAVVGLVVTVGSVLFYRKYTQNLPFENIFLYPFRGKPAYPNYAVFGMKHLSDILNLFLLVYPVGLVTLVVSWKEFQRRFLERTTVYLGLLTIGSLMFLLLIDPGLAMPRDWDLFCSCWIAPMIFVLHLVPESRMAHLQRLTVSLVLGSVLLVLPWLLVNLDEERGVAEIRQIITNNPEKSLGTLSLLGTYFQQKGNRESAEATLRWSRQMNPDFFKIKDAFQMMADGRGEEAYKLFQQARPDKFSKDYHSFLAGYDLQIGRPDDALAHARAAIQLQPYFDRTYALLAYAYLMTGDRTKAFQALRDGYALNSSNKEFLSGLALMNNSSGYPDSALFYAEKLRQLDSTNELYHFLCAEAYFALDEKQRAREEASLYRRFGSQQAGYEQNCAELQQLMPDLGSK